MRGGGTVFITENVSVLFKRAALKLTEDDDGNLVRLAEATFLIEPFPKELAHELGEDVAMHLFEADGRIAEAVESVGLRVRVGLQTVTVRSTPDVRASAELLYCEVKECRAERVEEIKKGKKTGRSWLSFQFVLAFDLHRREHRNFVIDEFGNQVCLSFQAEQADLPWEDTLSMAGLIKRADTMGITPEQFIERVEVARAVAHLAKAAGKTPKAMLDDLLGQLRAGTEQRGSKKGRKKHDPEAVLAEQVAAGAAVSEESGAGAEA